jgi:3-methyladenine DNA glycosylase AlkD
VNGKRVKAGVDFNTAGTRAAIVRELKKNVDEKYRRGAESYFKEGILLYGVRVNMVRKIAADFFKKVNKEDKKVIFGMCEELLQSKYSEEKTIAFAWAYRVQGKYTPGDFRLFEHWLEKYVSNWGACDDFCRHAFGAFVYRYPQFLPRVLAWTKSRKRWLKRGAAVVMIYSLRKGEHLNFAFKIADALMPDDDYLVQNGYGWMLKDTSIIYSSQVFNYIMRHKDSMPRRALRYAIERFGPEQRREAMGRRQ